MPGFFFQAILTARQSLPMVIWLIKGETMSNYDERIKHLHHKISEMEQRTRSLQDWLFILGGAVGGLVLKSWGWL
jgi:hypothetical protein